MFGLDGPDVDAELIMMTARLWRELGIAQHVRLELNSIGSLEARANYRTALIDYLEQYQNVLDEVCKRRMYTNPLRVLDLKNPDVQAILGDALSSLIISMLNQNNTLLACVNFWMGRVSNTR